MNFEQPKIEEKETEESTEEKSEGLKSLAKIDKENLSEVEKTKEFEELMQLFDDGIELIKRRKKEDGMGVLSKIGLNKKVEATNKEYDELTDKISQKMEELSEEIDMKGMFFQIFVMMAHGERVDDRARKEAQEELDKMVNK